VNHRHGIAVVAFAASFSASAELPHEVHSWLAEYVSQHRDFEGRPLEYPAREYMQESFGDVMGHGTEDFVLLFPVIALRGGNDWAQYLAVFKSTPQGLHYCCMSQVGAKGGVIVETMKVASRNILLEGKVFVPGADAYGAPSRLWKQTLKVQNAQLVSE
jgi:hypothetical protein